MLETEPDRAFLLLPTSPVLRGAVWEFAGISPSTVVESTVGEDEHEDGIAEGDYVQWESQGVLQFPVPRRVTGFSDDGEWAFVEGSNAGVLVSELTVADPPVPLAEQSGEKLKSALKVPPANPRYVPPPPPVDTRQDVFSIGEGAVTVQWPATLSAESFEDVSAWLDILKRKIGRSVSKSGTPEGDA